MAPSIEGAQSCIVIHKVLKVGTILQYSLHKYRSQGSIHRQGILSQFNVVQKFVDNHIILITATTPLYLHHELSDQIFQYFVGRSGYQNIGNVSITNGSLQLAFRNQCKLLSTLKWIHRVGGGHGYVACIRTSRATSFTHRRIAW